MKNLNDIKEGTLHRKLRYTRYKYRMCLAATMLVGVIAVAAALIIPAHCNEVAAVVSANEDVECEPSLKAGISRTTTELMINYIEAQDAVFVTNSLINAKKLSGKGYTVYILGGEFKSITEAIVGDEAVFELDKYNFTKGFWGANGINVKNGFTTPEIKEAMVKKKSMENSKEKYILADESKFSQISSIKFGEFKDAVIITNKISNENYKKYKNIKEVSE